MLDSMVAEENNTGMLTAFTDPSLYVPLYFIAGCSDNEDPFLDDDLKWQIIIILKKSDG